MPGCPEYGIVHVAVERYWGARSGITILGTPPNFEDVAAQRCALPVPLD
jgi:hypothetical protein